MNLSNLLQMQGNAHHHHGAGPVPGKNGTITPEGRQLLTDLVINVTLPCSIVKAFLIEFSMDILQSCIAIFLAAIVIQFLGMALSHILYPGYEGQRKRVLQYATICSNAGILGNSIAEGAFGSIGLMYASIYLIPQRSFMWSFGLTYFTVSPQPLAADQKDPHPPLYHCRRTGSGAIDRAISTARGDQRHHQLSGFSQHLRVHAASSVPFCPP